MAKGELFSANLILLNGKIVTVNHKNSIVEALAIKGNKIIAIGTSKEIRRLKGEKTKVLNLRGKMVLPGIIDSHTHPSHGATRFLDIDCRGPGIKSIKDIQKAVSERVKQLGSGNWVRGSNYNDSKLKERRQISRHELDKVAPDNPVILVSDTGHQSIVNSRALKIAGISKETVDPQGGHIDKDEKGELTGLLYETATQLVSIHVPVYTLEDTKQGLKRLFDRFSEWGITSTHDASGSMTGLRAYQQLLEEGYRKVRVGLMVRSARDSSVDALDSLINLGMESGFGDEWLRVISFKIMGDGSGAGGTSAVYTPQHRGTKGLGLMTTDIEDLNKIVLKAHKARIRCSIHSIGDRGIDLALDAIETAQKTEPIEDMRHRLEHNSCCTLKQLRRIKKLGVTPSSSIGYMYGIGDQYAENFGSKRSRWLHPHKTMKELEIIAGGNNDCPVTFYSPFVQIYAAVTRKTSSGQVVGAEEAISVMDAIRIYTWNGAYLSKEEDIKGSIEPEKLADLIIIDRDILKVPSEKIKDTKVLMTIVDGKIVYEP